MISNKIRSVIAISMALTVMFLSACGNTKKDEQASSTASTTTQGNTAVDPLAKYDTPVTVTIAKNVSATVQDFLKRMPGETVEKNRFTDLYKEKLNIDLKYSFVADSSQYNNKISIAIASGDLPDFFEVQTTAMLNQLVEADAIMPVDELYNKYASKEIKDLYNIDGGLAWDAYTINGKKMAVPFTLDAISGTHMLWIRNDWLKNLNLSQPKTADEIMNVIKAFTLNDPDKDGKANTYGIGMGMNLWNGFGSVNGFFNMFGAYPSIWVSDNGGNLVHGIVQPEVKTALGKLQEMYKAGYVDKEFGVKKEQQLREDTANGKLGLFIGEHYLGSRFQTSKQNNPEADWITLPLPGKVAMNGSVSGYAMVINKKAKNTDAFFKMQNLHYTINYGSKEDYEKYVDTGKDAVWQLSPLHISYYAAPEKNLFQQTAIANAVKGGNVDAEYDKIKKYVPKAEFMSNYDKCVNYEKAKDPTFYGMYLIFGPQGSERILTQYKQNNQLLIDKYFGPTTKTGTEKNATLNKLRDETFIKIIMGGADISEFDKFTSDWKKLGGDDITKEVNSWNQANKKK